MEFKNQNFHPLFDSNGNYPESPLSTINSLEFLFETLIVVVTVNTIAN